MGITSRLAEFVADTSFADLPENVIEKSKEMMLNATAVGLAGSTTEEGEVISEYVRRVGGTPVCTMFGASEKTSPANAALANGMMVHVLDYDEVILRRANHPSNVIFPTVMAVAEELGLSGESVVEAFAIGCEVSTKIGAAGELDQVWPALNRNGWHLESVAGTVAAAAAAGKLMGLDQEQLERALGIAVSQASGVQANYGTSTKSLHCGQAAMHGVMCATLAQDGLTASRSAIEDKNGFFTCFRRDNDVDEDDFIRCLGNPYDVIDPGVGLKLYPCGSALHTAIDVVLRLVAEHAITPDEVKDVDVSWPPRAGNDLKAFAYPKTGLQAKFSMKYVVAVALVYGAPRLHHFTDESVQDPKLLELLDRINVRTDEVATVEVSRPCTISITLVDGREFKHRGEHASGHPRSPLTVEQLDDKFVYCTQDILATEAAKKTIAQFRGMETISNVQPLFASLGAVRASAL